jgi:hypothetical protein
MWSREWPDSFHPFAREIDMLNRQVKVYVPGTVDANTLAPERQQEWVRQSLEQLSKLFGGATAINGQGAYVSEELGLIVEPVVIVTAFCDEAGLAQHREAVIDFARQLGLDMTQESVSVEFNGTMEFVDTKAAKSEAA